MRKYTAISIILIMSVFFLISCGGKDSHRNADKEEISYYTCGMHPTVKVSPEEYNKGQKNCPICNMNLVPVYNGDKESEEAYYGCGMEGQEHVFEMKGLKEGMTCPICGMPLKKLSKKEADKLKGVAGRVKIKSAEARLAGVRSEPIQKLHLFKEIRTVGKVAFDPQLAIAEEEFIAALKALDKIKEGNISEIKERAENLTESARRKLRLLGLGAEQIKNLEETKKVETSLILPEEKMWIYGDVYEYELSWLKEGGKVKITTSSLPGEEFNGIISSINPVLDPKTRSVRFRAEVENPGLKLKPEMYVDVDIMSMYKGPDGEDMILAVPENAVLHTGTRNIVWVDKGDGEYEGREVIVGPEATAKINGSEKKFYPALKGLAEGELVVTKANFLIDSESQLTGAASSAYGGALGSGEKKTSMPAHQH